MRGKREEGELRNKTPTEKTEGLVEWKDRNWFALHIANDLW